VDDFGPYPMDAVAPRDIGQRCAEASFEINKMLDVSSSSRMCHRIESFKHAAMWKRAEELSVRQCFSAEPQFDPT
jgi:hypothetical protein